MLTRIAGFTLVEIIVAIALVSVLAGVAAPYVSGWLKSHDLSTQVDTLSAQFFASSIRAKSKNQTVLFSSESSHFEFRSHDGAVDCSKSQFNGSDLVEQVLISKRLLIAITQPMAGVICFYPNGRTSGALLEVSSGENSVELSINPLSGIVSRLK